MKLPIGIALKAPNVRDDFVRAVDKAISAITQRPLTFPVVYGTKARRSIIQKFPYSIFFILDGDKIVIMSIFHDSRNPMIWQGRID